MGPHAYQQIVVFEMLRIARGTLATPGRSSERDSLDGRPVV